jgi:hypothetical protein
MQNLFIQQCCLLQEHGGSVGASHSISSASFKSSAWQQSRASTRHQQHDIHTFNLNLSMKMAILSFLNIAAIFVFKF